LSEADVDTDEDTVIEQEELEALTVAQLRAFAEDQNITLTATNKAGIITEILAAYTAAEGTTLNDADADSDHTVTREELEAMTVPALKALAAELSITLTVTRKADIIDEILNGALAIEVPVEDDQDAPVDVEAPGD
jgi:hypothetical protein